MAQFVRQWPLASSAATSTTTATFTAPTPAAAGATVAAVVSVRDAAASTCTATDPAGNTWTQVERLTGSGSTTLFYMHAQNVTPMSSVTVTVTGADGVSVPAGAFSALIVELADVGAVADFKGGYSDASPSAQNLVTAPAGGLVLGGGTAGVTNRFWDPAAFYTPLTEFRGGQITILGSWHVPSSSGPTAPSWTRTSGSSATLGNINVAYHPAATGPDPDPPAVTTTLRRVNPDGTLTPVRLAWAYPDHIDYGDTP